MTGVIVNPPNRKDIILPVVSPRGSSMPFYVTEYLTDS